MVTILSRFKLPLALDATASTNISGVTMLRVGCDKVFISHQSHTPNCILVCALSNHQPASFTRVSM